MMLELRKDLGMNETTYSQEIRVGYEELISPQQQIVRPKKVHRLSSPVRPEKGRISHY